METNKASRVSWKHIICCLILLVIFVLTVGVHINAEGYADDAVADSSSDTVPLRINYNGVIRYNTEAVKNEVELAGPKEEVTVNAREVDSYITTYADELEFFAKTFGVDYEDILADLHERYDSSELEFESTNIGFLLNSENKVKTYSSVEYGIVEYFYDYVEKHPGKVNKKRVAYSGDASYVENLIIYYTTHIYTNVDTKVALSIGAAESGYYKVKYMLRCNNIYGGMSSKGLIKYRNIEYGVLSYIRLLSKNYYGKGINTVSKIGRVYCPTYDNSGNKIASPHWMNLVNTAIKKYSKYNLTNTIQDLVEKDIVANL
ncbi:MAG: glucosaminidase domain-containing protein [Erysipelotrichales bacterium]|nr:glucosaminidase domain-containing protein [Erysipelotrichales bacterium]